MHRLKRQSDSSSNDGSFSSASSDDDVTSDEMQFESPRPPRFRDKTAAQLGLAKAGCRDQKGRPGRNCHTYSKGAGFSLANDGDYSRLPTEKSGSWRHVSGSADAYVLSQLLESSDTEALFTLVLMGDNLGALLENATLDCAALNTLVALLAKACTCRQTEHLRLLLGTVAANDMFLRNVEQQLVCRRRLPAFWDEFVVPLVKVVEKSVKLLPREGKNNFCSLAAVLLDLVNSSLQDTQPIDGNVVEAVESIGTLLAEANKLDFRQVVGRTHYASFPGDGDAGEKSSLLPEEFLQCAQLSETEVSSVRPATTTEYLRDQYSRLRQLFLQPLGKVLSTLQSFPVSAEPINIVIYTEVKIGAPVCTINGVGHKVSFSVVDGRNCESRLLPGCMVCLSNDGFQTVVHGKVLRRSFKDREQGHMIVSFTDARRFEAAASVQGFVMVECPELYEDYISVFDVMKQFEATQLQLPFKKYIVDGRSDPAVPGYMNNNTVFDMKALFKKSLFIRPHNDRDWPSSGETELDRYQYDAIQTAVSRDVTLVEGIPGTGKTFMVTRLVSVMLDNINVSHGGPIMIVSKDKESICSIMAQFEEVLDDVEIVSADSDIFQMKKRVLTAGHNPEVVEPSHLRLLRRHVDEIEQLKSRTRNVQDHLRRIPSRLLGESELKSVMNDKHYRSLFFTMVTGAEDKLRDWLLADNEDVVARFSSGNHSFLSEDEVCYISDVWELDMESRYRLYGYWRNSYCERKSREWFDLVERFKTLLLLKKEVEEKLQLDALRGKKILGATLSSLPKIWTTLRDIKPQIIIVLESRSIPEPFMLPVITLNPHHIVLISDTRNIFDLPGEMEAACGSLFERLVEQGVTCCQLLTQYKLNPNTVKIIDAFKTNTFLERYEFRTELSQIRGVSSNVRFVDHSVCYNRDNIIACALEAEFLASLAKYLLIQGYHPCQICVYAPTVDQVDLIKSNLCGLEEEPLVATVDKAKGCKNSIVLMSFSCPNTTYDFEVSCWDHYNAIASSTIGLFCIGNLTYLSDNTKTWKQVAPVLYAEGMVGPLELKCQIHPDKTTAVTKANDFADVIDGGCSTPCNAFLPCGHPCPNTCHLTDRDHQQTLCTRPCKKLLPCDHPCKALCGDPCQTECEIMVNALSPCNHVVRVPCSAVLNAHEVRSQCTEVCGKKISRGVRCTRKCRDCFLECTHLNDDVYFEEEPPVCMNCQIM